MPPVPERLNAASDPSSLVKIACRVNNGLVLESYAEVMDASTGLPKFEVTAHAVLPGTHALRDSSVVAIGDGGEYTVTPVPLALWEAWLKANAENSLVTGGMVYAIVEEPDKENP